MQGNRMRCETGCVALALAFLALMALSIRPVRAADAPILCLNTGGHTGRVSGLAFGPEGIISTGSDKSVRFWKTATFLKELQADRTLRYNADANLKGEIASMAFDPESHLLAIGTRAKSVQDRAEILIIDTLDPAGKLVCDPLADLTNTVLALAFSPHARQLAAIDATGTGIVYDIALSKDPAKPAAVVKNKAGNFKGNGGKLQLTQAVAFSPDGRQIAYLNSGEIQFHALIGKAFNPLRSAANNAKWRCLAWARSGALAAGDDFLNVDIFSNPANSATRTSLQTDTYPICLAFDGSGQRLAIGTDLPLLAGANTTPKVVVWANGKKLVDMPSPSPVTAIAFAEDGKHLAIGDRDGQIQSWRSLDDKPLDEHKSLKGAGGPVHDVAWSQDSSMIAWKQNRDNQTFTVAFNLSKMEEVSPALVNNPAPVFHLQQNAQKIFELAIDGNTISLAGTFRDVIYSNAGGRKRLYAARDEEPGSIDEYDATDTSRPLRTFTGYNGRPLGMSVSPDGRYLAMGSNDQMVRLWSLEPNNASPISPLIYLFIGDRNLGAGWAVWNPQTGFYTADLHGNDTICYQFNSSSSRNPAEVVPVATCTVPYRNEKWVRTLFASASMKPIEDWRKEANSKNLQETLQQKIINRPKLDVASIQVLDGDTPAYENQGTFYTSSSSVLLKAPMVGPLVWAPVNTGNTGARTIGVRDEGGAGEESALVPLTVGPHLIRVTAVNKDGVSSEPVYLRIERKPSGKEENDVEKPGALHVLSIGVSDYQDVALKLLYGAKDAGDIADVFANQPPGLYTKVFKTVLTQKEATRDAVMRAIDSLASSGEVKKEDTVVFFIAGHGGDAPATPDIPVDYLFAPFEFDNATEKSMLDTGVRWTFIIDRLAHTGARRTFLFIDHCFAGGITNLVKGNAANDSTASHASDIADQIGKKGLIAFMASGSGQKSREDPVWMHGAFTSVLLDALRGVNYELLKDDGTVCVNDVFTQLLKKVPKMVEKQFPGVLQKPDLSANDRNSIYEVPIIKYK